MGGGSPGFREQLGCSKVHVRGVRRQNLMADIEADYRRGVERDRRRAERDEREGRTLIAKGVDEDPDARTVRLETKARAPEQLNRFFVTGYN